MPTETSSHEQPRRFLLATAVAEHAHGPQWDRPGLVSALTQMIELFTGTFGYILVPTLGLNPTADQLRDALAAFCSSPDRRPTDIVAVYFTGHGERLEHTDEHVLYTADTDPTDHRLAVTTASMARTILYQTPVRRLLLMLDTCYSGKGGADFTSAALDKFTHHWDEGSGNEIVVITSAQPRQFAEAGQFPHLFTDAIQSLSAEGYEASTFAVQDLVAKINDLAPKPGWQVVEANIVRLTSHAPAFLPNPHCTQRLSASRVAPDDLGPARLAASRPRHAPDDAHTPADSPRAGSGIGTEFAVGYESYWTVLRGVLPVLDGTFSKLLVGTHREESIEFQLYEQLTERIVEGHQCVQSHDIMWSLAELRNVGLLDGLRDMASRGWRTVFVSEQVSVLKSLADKAKWVSAEGFRHKLDKQTEEPVFDKLLLEWGLDEGTLHHRLGLMSFNVVRYEALKRFALARLSYVMDGDPAVAVSVLWQSLKKTAPTELDSVELWSLLKAAGQRPRGADPIDLAGRLSRLADSYVHHAVSERPHSLVEIPRQQAADIIDAVTDADRPSAIMLTGSPGSGKSSVLAQVISGLGERGVVVGVMRLDDADPASTAEALGNQDGIGFGGSPVAVVARAKADRIGVLVIDQVDTMSRLSGRGDKVRWAVAEMLADLRASGDVTLIMACRSEDLTFDPGLRRLVGMDGSGEVEQPRQIQLADLTVAEVNSALDRVLIDPSSASPKQVELLRSPLNLGLFIEIFEDGSDVNRNSLMAVRSRINLLARYHQFKADRCRERLGDNKFAETALDVAAKMYEGGVLSLPLNRLALIRDSVDVLIHHGVLVGDHERVRFFHETYYEYLVALTVITSGRTASDVLSEGPQLLSRRGVVRAILTLERDDLPRYRVDLAQVMSRVNRSHIRGAVLSLLGTQGEVDHEEIALLLAIAADQTDPIRHQVVRTLTSKPFAEAMADQGLLELVAATYCRTGLRGDHRVRATLQNLSAQELLYLIVESARFRPDPAAHAALPILQQTARVDEWIGALIRLTHLAGFEGGTGTGTDLLKLFQGAITAICDHAPIENASTTQSTESQAILDRWLSDTGAVHAVDNFIDRFPAVAADAVAVWLDAALRIAVHHGVQQSVFDSGPLASHRRTGPNLRKCAEQTPLHYVRQLSNFVLDDYRRIGTGPGWTPTDSTLDPAEGLRRDARLFATADSLESRADDAIRTAIAATASSDSDSLAPLLQRFAEMNTVAAHRLLAVAYSNASGVLIDDAASWIADPRVRGLPAGATPGWAWGSVVARVVADGSDEQRVCALTLVTSAYGLHDEPGHAAAVEPVTQLMLEEHIVLSLLRRYAGGHLPETFSRRLDALDAVLGQAASEPAPLFWISSSFERDEDSVPADLEDSEWLAEIADWPDFDTDEERAYALKKGMRAAAERDPARFALLLTDFPNSAPATAVISVLEGISAALKARPETEELQNETNIVRIHNAIRNAFGRPHDPDLDIAIARCIHHLAGQPDLPEDIILLPTQICDLSRNPTGGEVWHDHLVGSAYSQPRGLALNTVAALLAPLATRSERLPLLKPLLEQVTTDPSEAVRVLVPQALVLTWSEGPEFVITLAQRWLASATPSVLEAPRLSELMWLMRDRSPTSTAAFLRAMATSPRTHARTAAARMATKFAVDNIELPGFDRPLLELFLAESDVRAAVADCLTQLVSSLPPDNPDEPEASPTLGLLLRLMNDEAEEVREQTTAVVRYLEGPLSTYADLLEGIRGTRMFSEAPAYVLDGLRRRLGELPDIVVALCEDWLQRWSAESGDISTHAAAEAYEVTDIVLATYHATSSEAMIERCLDILDRLIENGAGGANLRADEAA